MTTNNSLRYLQKKTTPGQRLQWKLNALVATNRDLNQGHLTTPDLLKQLRRQRDQAGDALDLGVLVARDRGLSWSRISGCLGIPQQHLEERMRRLSARLDAADAQAASS
jgi:hypothetical protein